MDESSETAVKMGLESRPPLRELGALFLRLGATAFGGPAVHIALLRHEVVERRRWLTQTEFLDLLGVANLIPGPTSTELAIHIGWARRRWSGLLVAGLSFILPAAAIAALLGWTYVRFGAVPEVGWLLYGVKPVVLAVVAQAIWSLIPMSASSWRLRALGAAALAASALGGNELAVLLGAGVLLLSVEAFRLARAPLTAAVGLLPLLPLAPTAGTAVAATPVALFWVFCKIGSVLFGSGYVLLAFLEAELVENLHWLTRSQLVDAIAIGQVTPGPLFTTATFIGYVLAGPAGAAAATAGIFLPAFVFVALTGPLVPRLRSSRLASAFLDGVNVSSLALMAVVTFRLAGAAIVDVPSALVAAAAALLLGLRVSPTWVILGGAAAGALLTLAGLAT